MRADQPQAAHAPGGAPAAAPQDAAAAYGAPASVPLPPEVDSGFAQVLHVLSGSKVRNSCFLGQFLRACFWSECLLRRPSRPARASVFRGLLVLGKGELACFG